MVVVRLAPLLKDFLVAAFELLKHQAQIQALAQAAAQATGTCPLPQVCACGWEKWVPAGIVASLILAAVAPTSFKDLGGLVSATVGAVKGILPGNNK